ncbi:MAG: hypothetical protein ACRDHF_13870 [Tepidiformaceae bacterium]
MSVVTRRPFARQRRSNGVNLASRIAAVAGRGEVLASLAVVEAVDGASFRFERLDERSLKGIAEPVALFRVTRNEQ